MIALRPLAPHKLKASALFFPFRISSLSINNLRFPYATDATLLRLRLNSPPNSPTRFAHSATMAESDPSSVNPAFCEIIVVRHGETEWNVDGRIQGHLDVELNDVGRQQAALVAGRLSREFNVSAVYSSDLKRALETAETIAASCGVVEVSKDPGLRERHLGDLQGFTLLEAPAVCTKAYQAFKSHYTNQEIPGGGESLDQLYQRCASSLQCIADKHIGQRVVVVTHGGVIRALYRRACPSGRSVGKVLNTSVNTFHLSNGGDWTIKSWCDVSHLDKAGVLESGFGGDRLSG